MPTPRRWRRRGAPRRVARPDPIALVKAWVRRVVVGEGLCPFAAGPLASGRVAFARIEGPDVAHVATEIGLAARRLLAAPPARIETVLLVCSEPWLSFDAALDVAALVSAHLEATGLADRLQVVTFHPDFRFEGAEADDPANATNRAPHPVFQLLRQASVHQATEGRDPAHIWRRNAAHLRRLGPAAVARLSDPAHLMQVETPEAVGPKSRSRPAGRARS
ncbi:MAG: DUF1415 domain-containing protein [Deltaproteobacteria bacterium]|nr:MAG: DUF1415 domain-containing protein [Deltaproteobacteria bacterium]